MPEASSQAYQPDLMVEALTIVIPVYNEAENFPALWQELSFKIKSDFQAIVVYDSEEDNTIPVVLSILKGNEKRLRLIKNNVRKGVVGALLTGIAQVQRGPVLVVMADLSDDLGRVDEMLQRYHSGVDIVAGSRYMAGGRYLGGRFLKRVLSRWAGLSLFWLRHLPTHDAPNAFKIYDREMLSGLNIASRNGFEINLEITVKAFLAGYRITEVPVTYRDRTAGESHFKLWAWLPAYLKWYLYAFRPRHHRPPRFLSQSA